MDVLVIGQSNASNWFHDRTLSAPHPDTLSWRAGGWNPVRGEGAVTFSATIANATGEPVRLLNAAEGNTSLLPVQGSNWLATGPGSLYGKMLASVAASGLKPDAIIWIQGERDAQLRVGTEAYRAGLETLFDRLAGDFGDVPVFLQPLILPQTGKDAIVAAQQAFAASRPNVTLLSPSVEIPARDQLHFAPAGYHILAELMAQEVMRELSLPSAPPIIHGTTAADRIDGTGDADRIYAGAGDDRLDGKAGNDTLLGESGNDQLTGGRGSDLMTGGPGSDSFIFAEAPGSGTDRITDFVSGADRLVFDGAFYSAGRLTHSNGNVYYDADGSGPGAPQLIATVQGSFAPSDISVSGAPVPVPVPNPISGRNLAGTGGADRLAGGAGNDTLDGGAGRDTLIGGKGDDTYIVSAGDQLSDSGGADHVVSNVTWTLGAGFENLSLTGTAHVSGVGNALSNHIVGNAGNNTISGREGNDNLQGGAGNDTLAGGLGKDTLSGGIGSDSFDFLARPGSANADRIVDFTPGTDKLRLDDAAHAKLGKAGSFSAGDARFWAAPGATRGHDASDRLVYDTSTGSLYYDADGSGRGAAVLIATFEGNPALTAGDIVVI